MSRENDGKRNVMMTDGGTSEVQLGLERDVNHWAKFADIRDSIHRGAFFDCNAKNTGSGLSWPRQQFEGGTRVYACCEECVRKLGYQRQKHIIPCILEEVELELCKDHSTMQIRKRLAMRVVNGFVVAFLPIGLLVYAASPLVDAALYLTVARNTR